MPGRAAAPARRRDDEAAADAARQAPGPARASTSWPAWSRASRRGSARPSRRSRRPAPSSRRSACPHTEYGLATYYIVAPAEASANLARYDGIRYGPRLGDGSDVLAGYLATRGEGFGAEVKRRIMLGTYALSAGYYDAYYLKAQKVRTLIKGDFDALWAQGFDALVAPTSPTVAFRFGARMADPVAMYLSDACTLPVNMAGLPGISIPAGLSEGLPVGLQFIGAPWSEAALLALARGYEAITADAEWRALEPTGLAAGDPRRRDDASPDRRLPRPTTVPTDRARGLRADPHRPSPTPCASPRRSTTHTAAIRQLHGMVRLGTRSPTAAVEPVLRRRRAACRVDDAIAGFAAARPRRRQRRWPTHAAAAGAVGAIDDAAHGTHRPCTLEAYGSRGPRAPGSMDFDERLVPPCHDIDDALDRFVADHARSRSGMP